MWLLWRMRRDGQEQPGIQIEVLQAAFFLPTKIQWTLEEVRVGIVGIESYPVQDVQLPCESVEQPVIGVLTLADLQGHQFHGLARLDLAFFSSDRLASMLSPVDARRQIQMAVPATMFPGQVGIREDQIQFDARVNVRVK